VRACFTSASLANRFSARHLLRHTENSPLCRRCGTENETSAHIIGECEALAFLAGLLHFGARGHSENKSGGYLEL
jgi:hypothetical protein